VGRVLERSKMGKFVRWDVIDGRLSWSFDQDCARRRENPVNSPV
jgi:hypothetical protein